jgi:hypothetical protein
LLKSLCGLILSTGQASSEPSPFIRRTKRPKNLSEHFKILVHSDDTRTRMTPK